jgi:glycosyltransferase involved in cell wall biosynthesis
LLGARSVLDAVTVTVGVCTHNRPHYLAACLDGLSRQTVGAAGFDIVVVDSASTGDAPVRIAELTEAVPNARLVRLDARGVSLARNAVAEAATGTYIAYIDDDAIPAPNWVETIKFVIEQTQPRPVVLGGRVLPIWEKPLPVWWPGSLRGILSIIEHEGQGEYRTRGLPHGLEPYAVNMIVHRDSMQAIGGFESGLGRFGTVLLSDEEVQLAWKLQDRGLPARYDSRVTVYHQIQAERLVVRWLLRRLYMQGVSTVITRRMLGDPLSVWREFPRRVLVALLSAPAALVPADSTRLLSVRWRLAYALGFVRQALGWYPSQRARMFRLICREGRRD